MTNLTRMRFELHKNESISTECLNLNLFNLKRSHGQVFFSLSLGYIGQVMFIFALLFVLMFTMSSFRKYRERTSVSFSSPPARVFVQPSLSGSTRRFLEGDVTLLKLKEEATLMVVKQDLARGAQAPAYLLKSDEPHRFETTLLSVDQGRRFRIHASLRDQNEVVVFHA